MACGCSGAGACSCPGGAGGALPPVTAGEAAVPRAHPSASGEGAVEPFPRQTLVGSPGGTMTYDSDPYDSADWKSIAWWLECFGSMPGVSGPPITAWIQTSESLDGPWEDLIPGGQGISGGQALTGSVEDPSSITRARIDVQQGEVSTVAFRFVARPR